MQGIVDLNSIMSLPQRESSLKTHLLFDSPLGRQNTSNDAFITMRGISAHL